MGVIVSFVIAAVLLWLSVLFFGYSLFFLWYVFGVILKGLENLILGK